MRRFFYSFICFLVVFLGDNSDIFALAPHHIVPGLHVNNPFSYSSGYLKKAGNLSAFLEYTSGSLDSFSLWLKNKGTPYRLSIISEVNPNLEEIVKIDPDAVSVILEEQRTKLYLLVRVIKDYVSETGLLPEQLSVDIAPLLSLSKEQLRRLYDLADYTIFDQYLAKCTAGGDNSEEQLIALYHLIKAGYYMVRLPHIQQVIRETDRLDVGQKYNFFLKTGILRDAVYGHSEKEEVLLGYNKLLETAMKSYFAAYLPQGTWKFWPNGSLVRGTSLVQEGFDFDFVLYVEEPYYNELFQDDRLLFMLEKLVQSSFSDKCQLPIQKNRRKFRGGSGASDGFLIQFSKIQLTGETLKTHIDINVLKMPISRVDYTEFWNNQIKQLAINDRLQLTADIRLMKFVMKNVVGAYARHRGGIYEGGIGSFGIEQLVIQSGVTQAKGTVIKEVGTFDKTIKFIYQCGWNEASQTVIPIAQVVAQGNAVWESRGINRLSVFSEEAWKRLVKFAVLYREQVIVNVDDNAIKRSMAIESAA